MGLHAALPWQSHSGQPLNCFGSPVHGRQCGSVRLSAARQALRVSNQKQSPWVLIIARMQHFVRQPPSHPAFHPASPPVWMK